MSDKSPQWKRPSDVMVMRKKKKPAVNSTKGRADENLKGSVEDKATRAQLSRKRTNPFGCSPSKRQKNKMSTLASLSNGAKNNMEKNYEIDGKSSTLWDMLSEADASQQVGQPVQYFDYKL